MNSISRTLPLLLMLAAACGLAACQTRTTAISDKAVCAVFPPIAYSGRGDTEETKLQVRQFNAARDSYCGGEK